MKTFTKKSTEKFNSKEFLFDTSTESSNTTAMNFFQQEQNEESSSRFEKFQTNSKFQKNSKLKLFLSEIISQQWFEFKMMKMKLKIMKLEV